MKKLLMLVVGGLLTAGVAQTVPVEFRDYDANTRTFTNAVRECTLVTSETQTMTSGWYAVRGTVVCATSRAPEVWGDVHFVLCDGASYTVEKAEERSSGIYVISNNFFTVYGQTEGTGRLWVKGGPSGAGIGGGWCNRGGTVTINGGNVTAIAGDIPPPEKWDYYGGAGIGGGYHGTGGIVTINGGTVTATGRWGGAGIGGGWGAPGGMLTVNGGAVKAQGGEGLERIVCGAAIGHGAGSTDDGTIVLSGGIFANEVKSEWCTDHADCFANPDPATRGNYPFAVLPMQKVVIGDHPDFVAEWTSGDGTVTNAITGTFFKVRPGTENVRVLFAAPDAFVLVGDAEADLGTVTGDMTFGGESDYRLPRVACPYLDYDWVSGQMTNAIVWVEHCTLVTTNGLSTLSDGGWYAVTNAVVFGGGKHLEVDGTAHLILCDNASLTITDPGENNAAISVDGTASFVIYGQTAGSGRLEVKGGNYAAGIGGDLEVAGGMITINGGVVTATGGDCAAGIGGGDMAAGGALTIHGGRVTAHGGSGSEDIGRGARGGDGGTVAITGGLFWQEPKDAWIVSGCETVFNGDVATRDAYPYEVMDRRFRVTPGQSSRSSTDKSWADDALRRAVISPNRDVAAVLTTEEALNRYAEWFTFRIVQTHDLVWYYYAIEAVLTDAAKSNLAETATKATRQIPVAEIAAMAENATTNVTVTGCEPGFYYTLHDGTVLTGIVPDADAANRDVLCGADGKVEFPAVGKPSDAAGFFRVGVDATK